MKNISLPILLLAVTLFSRPAFADNCGVGPACVGLPTEQPGITCCPVAVPFDGGLTLMLAAGGIGIGVRVMRKRKLSNS